MNHEVKKPKTIKLPIIVSIVFSIVLILLILYFTVTPDTLTYLSSAKIRYEYFLVAILLNICSWFLWGLRLKILSNAIDRNVKIKWWKSTKIVIANLFLASVTPSMAGGEPVRIHLLNKSGMNLGSATASVLGERLIDALFILICVPFALFILKDRIDIEPIRIVLMIGICVFIIGVALFLYMIKFPDKVKSFLIFLEKKISRFFKKRKEDESANIVVRINREVDNFHDSMTFFMVEGRDAFLQGGILTILMWSTGFMIPSMLLLGLGLPPVFIESYAAQILLLVIIMMPTTPGSTGVAEGSVAALYIMLIGSSNEYILGVFVLLFRLITYHMNLIAGAIFQYRIFKSVASFSLETIKKQK